MKLYLKSQVLKAFKFQISHLLACVKGSWKKKTNFTAYLGLVGNSTIRYIKTSGSVASLICRKELRGDMKHTARGTKS